MFFFMLFGYVFLSVFVFFVFRIHRAFIVLLQSQKKISLFISSRDAALLILKICISAVKKYRSRDNTNLRSVSKFEIVNEVYTNRFYLYIDV